MCINIVKNSFETYKISPESILYNSLFPIMDSTLQCPVCSSQKKSSILKLYQISLTNAVYLCEDQTCAYPVNCKWLMVERNYMELSEKKKVENLDVWLNKFIKNEKNSLNNSENSLSGDDFLTELFKEFDGVQPFDDNQPNFLDVKQDIVTTGARFEETIPELTLDELFNNWDAEISSADGISGANDFLNEFNQHTHYGNEISTNNTSKSDTRLENQNIEKSVSQNLHGNDFKSIHEVDTKVCQTLNDFSVKSSLHEIKTEVQTVAPCGGVSTVCNLKLKAADKFKNFKFHSVVLNSAVNNI